MKFLISLFFIATVVTMLPSMNSQATEPAQEMTISFEASSLNALIQPTSKSGPPSCGINGDDCTFNPCCSGFKCRRHRDEQSCRK